MPHREKKDYVREKVVPAGEVGGDEASYNDSTTVIVFFNCS